MDMDPQTVRRKRQRPNHHQTEAAAHDAPDGRSAKRVSRACDYCRSKKNRCDDARPSCQSCLDAGVQCTYGSRTKKRGLPTGYVRILETLWALVFETVPGAAETTLVLLRSVGLEADGDYRVTPYSSLVPAGTSLHHVWMESAVRDEIDRRVAELEADDRLGQQQRRRDMTEDADARPTRPWALPAQMRRISSLSSGGGCLSADALPGRPDLPPELPEDPWTLLSIYTNYSSCCLPIVPKHDMVRLLSTYQEGLSCTRSEMSVLWAAFAVASSLSSEQQSGSDSTDSRSSSYSYRVALGMMPQDDEMFSLDHARTLLLLGIVNMNRAEWKTAYLIVGRAVRTLLLLRSSSSDLQASNRLLLGAFILDTLTSAYVGAAPHLASQHMDKALYFEIDGPEEWDQGSWESNDLQRPIRALSIFVQLAKAVAILNDAIMSPSSSSLAHQALALDEWRHQLPKHCSPDNAAAPPTPPAANLLLVYDGIAQYISGQGASSTHRPVEPCARASYRQTFGRFASRGALDLHGRMCPSAAAHQGDICTRNSEQAHMGHDVFDASLAPIPPRPHPHPHLASISDRTNASHQRASPSSTSLPDKSSFAPAEAAAATQHGLGVVTGGQTFVDYLTPGASSMGSSTLYQGPDSGALHMNPAPLAPPSADDARAIQSLLKELSAQETGYGPLTSSFMHDLGFFDAGLLPEDVDL